MKLASLCLPDLREAYQSGLDPVEVIEWIFNRITEIDDPGLFVDLFPIEMVLADVERLKSCATLEASSSPLWGVPFVVKDNIDVAGRATTAGCPAFTYTPTIDAFCVERLRAAGAILIGKANLDQFATGLVGLRTLGPAPRNAIDDSFVPGGSSSGSAVSVAHGIATFALGTDTAGSGRVPAGLNGIVGLKPTLGAISSSGVVPACRTLDTVSIFSLSCSDAAEVLQTLVTYDQDDPYCRRPAAPPPKKESERPTLAVPAIEDLKFLGDQNMESSFHNAVSHLKEMVGHTKTIDFSVFSETAQMLYDGPWVAERLTVVEDVLKRNPEALHVVTREVINKGATFNAVDTFRAFYRLAELKRRAEILLEDVDVICVPTVPKWFRIEEVAADPISTNSELGHYTNFVNLLDMCAVTVPVQGCDEVLPGSVTLLSSAHRDFELCKLAAQLQATASTRLGATAWSLPALTI